ncbi:S-protein homolog 5-like [Abrus precatorius]|uniref:S-protein homolog n=1 Tax=Abrus precatorius TaxID=3816 RepID=A0A8B8KIQ6_ABRPR|nr:S-protein homolog 5-like [Abrus precatorius]
MAKALGIVALLLTIIAVDTLTLAVPVDARKHVRVINELGNEILLYVHCKSGDDDLGLHILEYEQYQEWSFKNNLSGTTLFWCSLRWNDEQQNIEVYNYRKDNKYCSSKCWRSIKKDGAYFYIETLDHWERKYWLWR